MKFSVKNFKALKYETTVNNSGINIITGQNGSGKSSIAQALLLLKENLKLKDGKWDVKSFFQLDLNKLNLGNYEQLKNWYSDDCAIKFSFQILDYDFYLFDNKKCEYKVDFVYIQGANKAEAVLNSVKISASLNDYHEPVLYIPLLEKAEIKPYINYGFFFDYFSKNRNLIMESEIASKILEDSLLDKLGNHEFYYSMDKNPKEIEKVQQLIPDFKNIEFVDSVANTMDADYPVITLKNKETLKLLNYRGYKNEFEVAKNLGLTSFHNYKLSKFLEGKQNKKFELLLDENKDSIPELSNELMEVLLGKTKDEILAMVKVSEKMIFDIIVLNSFGQDQNIKLNYRFDKDSKLFDGLDLMSQYVIEQLYQEGVLKNPLTFTLKEQEITSGFISIKDYIDNLITKVLSYLTLETSFINYFDGVNILIKKAYHYNSPDDKQTIELLKKAIDNSSYIEWNDFVVKWLKEFEIGEDIKIELNETGDAYLPKIKKGNRFTHLASEGTGKVKLVFLILNIANSFFPEEVPSHSFYYNSGMASAMHGDYFPNILIIEEPEAFLHPNYQSKLADLFVDAAGCWARKSDDINLGSMFIIETHSEYLIRKLQLLKAKGVLDEVSLYYFGKKESWNIDIEDNGSLSRPFGKGFFDEADEIATELFYNVHNKFN